jgi:hypothetical protein
MFLKLVIGACWWETTHEHSCALHFLELCGESEDSKFLWEKLFFSSFIVPRAVCLAGGVACLPAIKLPWLHVIARLRYPVSFRSQLRGPLSSSFLIQELLTMALPPAEKKEPMEGKFFPRESSD